MDFVTSLRNWCSGSAAQHAFRSLTSPYRWVRRGQCARGQSFPVAMLFYHRVADREPNPWTIDSQSFRRQLDWLQRNFDLISLAEAQQRLFRRESPRPAVCITFDDGYAENLENAIPWLLERRIPCAYFISWEYIARQTPFPHDIARNAPLPVNSAASIRAMADVGIEIGSHALSHCDFGQLRDPLEVHRELSDSKRAIEDCVGRAVTYFAFPYGQRRNLSRLAFELGAAAGYQGMCSAYGGYNYPQADPFHLLRFHGDPRLAYLKNWLTFDPRFEQQAAWQAARDPAVAPPPPCAQPSTPVAERP